MISAILLALPITDASYDFRTDIRSDDFNVSTDTGVTTANVVLTKDIYEDDTQTITLASSISESPSWTSYNATAKTLALASLTDNTTRTLTVDYDFDALEGAGAISGILDRLPLIWLLMIIALPVAALVAIWKGKT